MLPIISTIAPNTPTSYAQCMSQPTPYVQAYSFSDFSARTPTAQTPGVKLDAEFAHIGNTLGDVLTNLALIQRDDGKLKNGSVGADQIDSTFFVYILDQVYALAVSGTMVALAARPTFAALAANGGAALLGTSTGVTVELRIANEETARLAGDALRPTSTTLAGTGGAALIGATGGITVQAALNLKAATTYVDAADALRPTSTLLAANGGAALVGSSTGVTVEARIAAEETARSSGDSARPTSATLAANGGAALIGSSTGVTVEARIAAEETARSSGDSARPTSATLAAAGGAALIGATGGGTVQSELNLKAPLASPALTGTPTVPTAAASTNSTQAASTAYADAATLVERTRALAAEALLAPLASPALTGTPTAPTATAGTSTTQVATTAFATTADALRPTSTMLAANGGAALIGTSTGVTVEARIAAEETARSSGDTARPTSATLAATGGAALIGATGGGTVQSELNLKAPLASPALTGTPTVPTAAASTNTTQAASTAYADAATLVERNRALAAEALLAPLASPTLTGVPVAPTAAANTNTTQIATTAFATTADALRPTSATLAANGGAALIGSSTGATVEARIAAEETARSSGDSARPTSATLAATGGAALIGTTAGNVQSDLNLKAPLASPALTGTPTVPTAAASTNTTQAASTAYADAATLVEKTRALAAEALLAPLASPALTGTPTGPTAAANTSTTQVATTAFATTADALRPTSTTLAATGGAALIGSSGGGTVQDAIFVKGPTTAVVGTTMATDWLKYDAGTNPTTWAGLWADKTYAGMSYAKEFTNANSPVTVSYTSPAFGTLLTATANGSLTDVCAFGALAMSKAAGSTVFGGNIIAGTTGAFASKVVGLEIDCAFTIGATASAGSGGLFINVFNATNAGPVIQTGKLGTASWSNGIALDGLATTAAGLFLSGGSADSLINTTSGTYTGVAVTLGTGSSRGILFSGTGASKIYGDGTNIRVILPTSANWIWRDAGDTTSLVVIDPSGSMDLQNAGAYRISGTQVMSSRKTGWAAASGTATRTTFATSTVTLPLLAERVKALIDDFLSHGAIGA